MTKFKKESDDITGILGLKWAPIAGKFTDDVNDPKKNHRFRTSVCGAFRKVRDENIVISLSKENCTCAGGRHFTGLQIAPIESLSPSVTSRDHRVYDSQETALASIRKQPQPVKRGDCFILGPLEKFDEKPDLTFLFVNPAQADRMLGLISLKGVEPFMYYPASSICSTITNVLAKNKPEINLIAMFERKAGGWSENELILAMPFRDFETAVKNIPYSGYGSYGKSD